MVRYVGIELLWQVKTSLPETLLDEGLEGQFKNTPCTTLCHRRGTLSAWQLSLLSEQTSALSTLEDRLLLDNCCHLDFVVFSGWSLVKQSTYFDRNSAQIKKVKKTNPHKNSFFSSEKTQVCESVI